MQSIIDVIRTAVYRDIDKSATIQTNNNELLVWVDGDPDASQKIVYGQRKYPVHTYWFRQLFMGLRDAIAEEARNT